MRADHQTPGGSLPGNARCIYSSAASLLLSCVLGLSACDGGGAAAALARAELAPAETCSDLARALARAQGREFAVCGSTSFRSLVVLADGYLLSWTPVTAQYELWQLQADGSFGAQPLAADAFEQIRLNRQLTGNAGKLLEYNQKTGLARLWQFDPSARGHDDPIPEQLGEGSWPLVLGGREFVPLGDDHWLEWRAGSGQFEVVEYQPGPVGAALLRKPGVGNAPVFRRGEQLMYLAPGRLLDWDRRTGQYRIWSYSLERATGLLFDPVPVATGDLAQLGPQHELLLLAADRLGVWDRESGTLEVVSFDPESANLLDGSVQNTTADDRWRSPLPAPVAETPTASRIQRIVIVFNQGRSFDAYFGRYCRAPATSAPSCEAGPDCCEAAPASVQGNACQALRADAPHVPNELGRCLREKLDTWPASLATATPGCGDPLDFVCADPDDPNGPVNAYHVLARQGALADRYFSSIAESAELNFVYFGLSSFRGGIMGQDSTVLSTLLNVADVPFALYLPSIQQTFNQEAPDHYDGSWAHFRSVDEILHDIAAERLPAVSIVVPGEGQNEAPGEPPALVNGVGFASSIARAVLDSPRYAPETLVVITHLSGGGFYDHVTPPPPPPATVDPSEVRYGQRVPFLALGSMVRKNHVSHVQLEHSSLTAFVEWNWLGAETGQLGGRDGWVNNLGSLLDAAATGTLVP